MSERLRNRSATELVILVLAIAVGLTILANGIMVVLVGIFQPERDISGAAGTIADLISTVVAALFGYLAGLHVPSPSTGGTDVVSSG